MSSGPAVPCHGPPSDVSTRNWDQSAAEHALRFMFTARGTDTERLNIGKGRKVLVVSFSLAFDPDKWDGTLPRNTANSTTTCTVTAVRTHVWCRWRQPAVNNSPALQLSTVTTLGFCCRISIYTEKSACVLSLRLVKGWKLRNRGSNPGRGKYVCLLQFMRNGCGPTQHPVNWVKPFGRVADHSCPSGTEDNSWSLPTIPPTPWSTGAQLMIRATVLCHKHCVIFVSNAGGKQSGKPDIPSSSTAGQLGSRRLVAGPRPVRAK